MDTDPRPDDARLQDLGLDVLADGAPASRAPELQPDDGHGAPGAEPSSWDALSQQVLDQARRSGMFRVATQALLLVLAFLLALRLVFDEVLPRVLLAAMASLTVLGVTALIVRGVAEARRQRALLMALAHVTRTARADLSLGAKLVPQVEALVAALRAPPAPILPGGEGEKMLSTLVRQAALRGKPMLRKGVVRTPG